jgi:epoxyqueuosine reductase
MPKLGAVVESQLVGALERELSMPPILNQTEQLIQLRSWAHQLGFTQLGIAGIDLASAEPGLKAWLAAGFHGEMAYMQAHGMKRARPAELLPGTVSVITLQMPYLPQAAPDNWAALEWEILDTPSVAAVSLYARGRDYHKVVRQRLQKLVDLMAVAWQPFQARVFTDSAPVLEVELASASGIGWRGKHTLALTREHGSLFFLGEIFVDLYLAPTAPVSAHCGSCQKCIDVCPTRAIVAPYKLDARRCISYLTIEHPGPIPEALRPLIGNRIYGCDDCQLVCPWNKFAVRSTLPDFDARAALVAPSLAGLMAWNEARFLKETEGSPIRRIGHERWQRNVAVAAGNALTKGLEPEARTALKQALAAALVACTPMVADHINWALEQDLLQSRQ